MQLVAIIGLAMQVLWRIVPIALDVYKAVSDPNRPEVTAADALEWIKKSADARGLVIGNTEAELARSAVHYALAKDGRHANLAP